MSVRITNSSYEFEVFYGKGEYNDKEIKCTFKFIFEPDLKLNIISINPKNITKEKYDLMKLEIANYLKDIYKKYIKGL